MTHFEDLPGGIFCITLSHVIDDVDIMEKYFEQWPAATARCVPLALRDVLSPDGEAMGFPPMKIPSARETRATVYLMWLELDRVKNLRSVLESACRHGLTYFIPYILKSIPQTAREYEKISELVNSTFVLADAVRSGNAETVLTVLKLGASVESRNEALKALSSYRPDIIDLLISPTQMILPGAGWTNLPITVGADIASGDAILAYAMKSWMHEDVRDKIIKYLVSRGANIDGDVAHHKGTLISATLIHGDVTAVKLLVENKANIHVENDSPLYNAVRGDTVETVRYLTEQKADVNSSDLLSLAAVRDARDLVSILIKAGADVHRNGDAAIRTAVRAGAVKSVTLLIDARADITAVTDEEVQNASPEMRRILASHRGI